MAKNKLKGDLPTHNIVYKHGDIWVEVGVGWWSEEKQSATLKLNPLVDLSRMEPGETLRLFPRRRRSLAVGIQPAYLDDPGPSDADAPPEYEDPRADE